MVKTIFKGMLLIIMLALVSGIVYASLGTFEEGETVYYSVVCLTDDGTKDSGCTNPASYIYDPDDTSPKFPTSEIAEVDETNAPGLWRGYYTIPSDPMYGTWSIYVSLTNSNGTKAATVLHFQVVNKSFEGLKNYVDDIPEIKSDTDEIINNITDANYGLNALSVNINETPSRVWNNTYAPNRFLTAYPVGISYVARYEVAGYYNYTIYNSEVAHVFGTIEPPNAFLLKGGKWIRNDLVLMEVPTNITNAELCFWMKRVGSPTGNLSVFIDGNFLFNISASTVDTNWNKNCTNISAGYVDGYNSIVIRGESGWDQSNRIDIGLNSQAALYSYYSEDNGASWSHTDFESIIYLNIIAYEVGRIDQIYKKTNNIWSYLTNSSMWEDIANEVWSWTTRTLTSFGTLISDIWNYATRTLTAISYSIFGDWDILQENVWNYSNRSLTYYENVTADINATKIANCVWGLEDPDVCGTWRTIHGYA